MEEAASSSASSAGVTGAAAADADAAVRSKGNARATTASTIMSTRNTSQKRPRPTDSLSEPDPSSSLPNKNNTSNNNSNTNTNNGTRVTQTPHTLRLLRLCISGTPSHSSAARTLLSELAGRSSPDLLWDLLGRLVSEGSAGLDGGGGSGSRGSAKGSGRGSRGGLYSARWAERAQASEAMGAVAAKLPGIDRRGFWAEQWSHTRDEEQEEEGLWLTVDDLLDESENEKDRTELNCSQSSSLSSDYVKESKLDIILRQGRLLLSSSGERYTYRSPSYDDYNSGNWSDDDRALQELDESAVQGASGKQQQQQSFLKRRVRLQRQILARRLGLGGILSAPVLDGGDGDGDGNDDGSAKDSGDKEMKSILESMVDDDDLLPAAAPAGGTFADKTLDDDAAAADAAAARRRNVERRRKKRRSTNNDSSGVGIEEEEEGRVTLRALLVLEMRRSSSGAGNGKSAAPSHRNPQTLLATDLLYRTFDADWTVRHGALLGILALVKSWRVGGADASSESFGRWPHDIMARCLCILALDRFGDYSGSAVGGFDDDAEFGGDRIMAPVRETASQLLSLLVSMAPDSVQASCHAVLSRLSRHESVWEIRHGAMLAFKYIAALHFGSRKERSSDRSCSCWDDIPSLATRGLSDESDDVRGASAQVLASYFLHRKDEYEKNCRSINLDDIVKRFCPLLWSALIHVGPVSSCAVDIISLFADIVEYDCDLALSSAHDHALHQDREQPLGYGQVLQKLTEFISFDDQAAKLASLRALGIVVRPMVNRAVTGDDSASLEATINAYCCLLSELFSTYFLDEGMPEIKSENEQDDAITLKSMKTISSARDVVWEETIRSVPSIMAHQPCTQALCNLFTSLLLRFVGIDFRKAQEDGNPGRYDRIDGSLETLDESSSINFARQRSAASALASISLHLGLVPTDQSNKEEPGDSFLAMFLKCLAGSPWPSMCESSCLLFAAIGDAARKRSVTSPDLSACRDLFTSMLVGSSCSMLFAAENGSAFTLRDPNVVSACDLVLISTLESNAMVFFTSGRTNSAKMITSNKVFELWQGIFRAGGLNAQSSWIGGAVKGTPSTPTTAVSMRLASSVAGATACCGFRDLPIKLTPIIRPLMTSLKNEESASRLDWTCSYLAHMLSLHSSSEVHSSVRDKILKNVCLIALVETDLTNRGKAPSSTSANAARQIIKAIARDMEDNLSDVEPFYGILLPLKSSTALESDLDMQRSLSLLFLLSQSLQSTSAAYTELIDEFLGAVIHLACRNPSTRLRGKAADTTSFVCKSDARRALETALPILLQYLNNMDDDSERLWSCMLLERVLDSTGIAICPFVRSLLPVTMSLMTDRVEDCSKIASGTFAALVRVSPLVQKQCSSAKNDSDASQKVIDHLIHGEPLPPLQLPSPVEQSLNASGTHLRRYQQEGIAWINFLQSVKLNGALCDDMGTGKSLQALIGLALAHSEAGESPISLIVCPSTVVGHWMNEIRKYFPRKQVFQPVMYTGAANKRRNMGQEIQAHNYNIVVTSYSILRNDINVLSGLSWTYCVLDEGHLLKNPKSATAKASRRIRARNKLLLTGTPVQNNVNELWAAFDFLMPNFLGTEAAFTKSFAKPIINGQVAGASPDAISLGINKLKLLHQTVLPFILRREKQDVMKELPPKVISDVPCVLSKEQTKLYRELIESSEAKQALAALQRSMDAACEDGSASGGTEALGQEVLKSLLLLRLVCTHPLLVTRRAQNQNRGHENGFASTCPFSRLDCSGKLMALKDLLQSASICSDGLTAADNDQSTLYVGRIEPDKTGLSECGIDNGDILSSNDGTLDGDSLTIQGATQANHSKCLIFAQFSQSLDIVQEYLFDPHMPSLRYLRIDGQVAPEERTKRVDQFNQDESVKVMLLTTRVGGLGLNLTGADTVIFLEPDWNPFSDLQAMDRAHRLGQTKTVNVYRLITSETIEEKIMNVQSAKLKMSKAIVNSDNSTMYSMGTDRLLDIFTFEERDHDDRGILSAAEGKKKTGDSSSVGTDLLDDNLSSQQAEYLTLSTKHFLADLNN